MKKLKMISLVLTLLTTASHALTHTNKKIKRIFLSGDRVYVKLHDDTCLKGNSYYYINMNDTTSEAKNTYSLLLASAMASRPVSVRITACPEENKHVEIIYVYQDYQ